MRPDDRADRLLDREKHPAWQGERTKMMYSFPTDEALRASMQSVFDKVTPSDAAHCFKHCGYTLHDE